MTYKTKNTEISSEERNWAIAQNLVGILSLLNTVVVLVAVLAVWLIKGKEFPLVDRVGRHIVNFWVTVVVLIWANAGIALGLAKAMQMNLLVPPNGLPLALATLTLAGIGMLCLGVFFSVIGAIQANQGKVFKYPGGIPFLKQKR